MKKSFFVLGVAVAALASCTNEEVVDMPQSRAIQFGTFVNHSTRSSSSSVTETTDLTLNKFFVFGSYDENSKWIPVYTNVQVNGGQVGDKSIWTPTQTAYWQVSKDYLFGAYSDGDHKNNTATFDETNKQLVFENYTAENGKDLIVAISKLTSKADATQNTAVNLSFYHMLSQVKFTFENTDSPDYTMKISDIKVSAVKTTKGTATYGKEKPTILWETTSSTPKAEYDFGTIEDIAEEFKEDTHTTTCFVIPQSNENLLVTFTATFSDKSGKTIAQNKIKGSLKYSGNAEGTEQGKWTEGFKYNYTVEINGSTIDPDLEGQEIKFQVEAVNGWETASNTDIENPEVNSGE
ncbi:fimbrillin family protein [Bacteroides fragilis]